MKLFLPAIALLAATFASPARAGDVKLQVANGRVTLQAKDAYVRDILAEWGRLGQVKIINAERVMSQPVTLDLQDVPEADALATLLRGVSGFMAAPRDQAAGPNASVYDRIVIMAAPRPMPTNAAFTPQPAQPAPYRGFPQPGMMNPGYVDDQDQPAGAPSYPGYPQNQPIRGVLQPQAQPTAPTLPTGAPGTVSPIPQVQPGAPGGIQPGTGAPGTITPPPKNPGGPGQDGGV